MPFTIPLAVVRSPASLEGLLSGRVSTYRAGHTSTVSEIEEAGFTLLAPPCHRPFPDVPGTFMAEKVAPRSYHVNPEETHVTASDSLPCAGSGRQPQSWVEKSRSSRS